MAIRRGRLLELLVLVGIIVLLISILLPSYHRMKHTSGRLPCPSNLRQIGQALLLHARDHEGFYPSTLDTLVTPDRLTAEVLSCHETRKPFVFLTPGARAESLTEDDPVAYEPPEYHDGEGSNVLFGDGHVSWLSAGRMKLLLARAATRPAATMPATTP